MYIKTITRIIKTVTLKHNVNKRALVQELFFTSFQGIKLGPLEVKDIQFLNEVKQEQTLVNQASTLFLNVFSHSSLSINIMITELLELNLDQNTVESIS